MRANYDITVFAPTDDNYETEGLCGPLTPIGEPVVAEEAGGEYCLDLEHPYDPAGKWKYLLPGYTLRAWVQMRMPPDPDDMGSYASTVEVWTVARTAGKADRYLYSTRADGEKTKKLKLLKGGAKVTIVKAYEAGRWKVKCAYGNGWMNQAGLDGSTKEIIHVDPGATGLDGIIGVEFRPQLFDIESVERTRDGILVHALQASYRLMKNVTRYVATGNVKGVTAARALLNNCLEAHEFSAYSDIADTRAGASWNYVNPIEAIMDPETGFMRRWNAELLRDNFDLYLLHSVGVDRGVTIEVGRNLAGITVSEDWSEVATYVMPLGEKADGTVLLLPERWLVSGRAANYPQKYIYVFWAEDAVVDDDTPQSTVLTRMRTQAQALLDGGCDLPRLTVEVEVAQVDDPRAERVVEALEPVLVYDTVRVYDIDRGIELTERVIRREVDPVHGRLISCVLGNSTASLTGASLASWQVPSGLSGAKIEPGTLDGISLKDNTLYLKRLIAEAITGDLIAGQTITAQHLAAGAATLQALEAVTAKIRSIDAAEIRTTDITAQTLTAALAKLARVIAEDIRAGSLAANSLSATAAELVTAQVGLLDVDYAHVKDLDADEAIITDGEAGSLYIDRLSVTSANLVNAVIGHLVLTGDDGEYYGVHVGAGGVIGLEALELTAEEIAAGVTGDGRQIVADVITAEELSGSTVKAESAILGTILTHAVQAQKVTAMEAVLASADITDLRVRALNALGRELLLAAEEAVRVLIGNAADYNATFAFTDEGLRTRIGGSKWSTLVDEAGFYVDHEDVLGHVGAFHEDTFEPRSIRMGELVCKPTSGGGWAWKVE